ncbi:MAG TPA: C-GCAxxG-C-C family protein [Candidatus Desulfaltia sp.]|nr:C-GCAxxG-C-C family protein [Candidatus Desulfaltia sp.]
MNRAQDAVQTFQQGFSCSQAVMAALSEPLGLEREKALKISQAFGGGLARMGLTCGAVAGALMIIGLKYGRTRPEDEEAREKTYRLVHEFYRRFQDIHGSTVCRELIGVDLNTPEGHKQGEERGVFTHLCPRFVSDAVTILEQIL